MDDSTLTDTINDLKQFIAATVSQSTADMVARMDKLEAKVDNFEQTTNRRFDELETKLETVADAQPRHLKSTRHDLPSSSHKQPNRTVAYWKNGSMPPRPAGVVSTTRLQHVPVIIFGNPRNGTLLLWVN